MLSKQTLIGFVSATEPVRAKAFYQDTLGLRLIREELPFVLLFDAGGMQLTIHLVGDKFVRVGYTVLGWAVDDIAVEIRELAARGVNFERYPGMEQDELGVWTAPGGGAKVAWFKDPDGNLLSLSQMVILRTD